MAEEGGFIHSMFANKSEFSRNRSHSRLSSTSVGKHQQDIKRRQSKQLLISDRLVRPKSKGGRPLTQQSLSEFEKSPEGN